MFGTVILSPAAITMPTMITFHSSSQLYQTRWKSPSVQVRKRDAAVQVFGHYARGYGKGNPLVILIRTSPFLPLYLQCDTWVPEIGF